MKVEYDTSVRARADLTGRGIIMTHGKRQCQLELLVVDWQLDCPDYPAYPRPYPRFYGRWILASGKLGAQLHRLSLSEDDRPYADALVHEVVEGYPGVTE